MGKIEGSEDSHNVRVQLKVQITHTMYGYNRRLRTLTQCMGIVEDSEDSHNVSVQ